MLGLFYSCVSCSAFVLICTVVVLYCFVMCGCVCVCVGFVIRVCVCMCRFCNVCECVCVCVGFVTCRYSSATLTEGFPPFFLSCKANARVKLADGARPALFQISCYLCHFDVICVVLCIVCAYGTIATGCKPNCS
jgi:hypothetical protein